MSGKQKNSSDELSSRNSNSSSNRFTREGLDDDRNHGSSSSSSSSTSRKNTLKPSFGECTNVSASASTNTNTSAKYGMSTIPVPSPALSYCGTEPISNISTVGSPIALKSSLQQRAKDMSPGNPSRSNRCAGGIEKSRNAVTNYNSDNNNSRSNISNNIDDNGNDAASQADYSLSTAPDPPSLVRGHYSMRPGAYRMSSGGVARYVSGGVNDDMDNYSVETSSTLRTNLDFSAGGGVALDASLVQDLPLSSTPSDLPSNPPIPNTIDSYNYNQNKNDSGHNNDTSSEDQYDGRGYEDKCQSTVHSMECAISMTQTATTAETTNTSLASPVEENSTFDKDRINRTYFNKRNTMCGICILVLVIIVLASIGAVYAITGFGSKKNDYANDINTESQSVNNFPSSVPPPPLAPVDFSSPALKRFIEALPGYTKQSLQLENSPQSKAMDWMVYYEDIELYTLPRQLQRFALITLYFSIASEDPSHETLTWLSGLDECMWYDSTCVNNVYTMLSLQSNHTLRGTIVPELALLSSLEYLRLDQNALVGVFPTTLGQMTTLKEIHLNDNLFRGTIPRQFGNLTNLVEVNFSNNLLSGKIPTEIGLWNKLQTLKLGNNSLTGLIPSEIGQISQLTSISVSSNKLEGYLPSELGLLRNLENINVERNQFAGRLPFKFGKLGSLQCLRLSSNQFSGTLPSYIGLLTSLEELDVSENRFTGIVPTEAGFLTSLKHLGLNSNSFEDSVPSELGLLTNAESFWLHDNSFTGTVPYNICELTRTYMLQRDDITVDCYSLFCSCCTCVPK